MQESAGSLKKYIKNKKKKEPANKIIAYAPSIEVIPSHPLIERKHCTFEVGYNTTGLISSVVE